MLIDYFYYYPSQMQQSVSLYSYIVLAVIYTNILRCLSIDPEEARVQVPDERFDWLCKTYAPKSEVPAALTIIDIAGLTAGASTGAGLGNAFLSHVRAVDGIFQVIRKQMISLHLYMQSKENRKLMRLLAFRGIR